MKNTATVILEVKVREDKIAELEQLLLKNLPETRTYKGFISIKIHKNVNDSTFVFYEEWETFTDYEAYLKWRTDTGLMELLGETFASPPTIRYWETVNV